MKLTVLGSGSPEAYARRASAGHLVEIGDTRILLDCGGGVVDRLLQAGLRPSDIDILFFSHLHSDHMMDYARLVHAAWDEGGVPLRVVGPAPIATITERFFGAEGAFAHDLVARTELQGSQEVWLARGGTLPRPWPAPVVTEVTPGFRWEEEGWRLTSCEVPHAQPHLDCMALRIEADGRSLVYSGDAGITPGLKALANGADILLHWCYRLDDGPNVSDFMRRLTPTPADIAAMASDAGVKRLVLTHFREHMDAPGAHERALAAMAEVYEGNAVIAEDLDVSIAPDVE